MAVSEFRAHPAQDGRQPGGDAQRTAQRAKIFTAAAGVGAAPSAERLGGGDARHTLFREETRWPGYYYRGDHPKLDDQNWHCFTVSRYDRESVQWTMEKAPVCHIID